MPVRERAIIVGCNHPVREALARVCRRLRLATVSALSWAEARPELAERYFALIILCLEPRGDSAMEMIRAIRGMGLDSCILIVAPPRRSREIISCLRRGAYDTILTPIREEWAEITITRAIERRSYYNGARLKDHYRKLSIYDDLTRIHNHRHFHYSFRRGVSSAQRYGYPISLLLMDLDDFKAYNDAYGHLEGDRALQTLGAFLFRSIRAGDTAARYGGEEFAVVLHHTEREGALVTAERLRRGVEGLNRTGSRPRLSAPLTVSIGVATLPEDGTTKDALILKADKALYRAKRAGKNRVCG